MALIATKKDGSDAQSTDSLDGGKRTRVKYWVNSRDHLKALDATGLPKKGDVLAGVAGVVALNVVSRQLGGVDNASGENGTSEVWVEYGPESEQPFTSLPVGKKHTVISIANESVEIGAAVNDAGAPITNAVFNNKKSASKILGRITAEIYDFRALNYSVPYTTLIGLAADKALNSDAITLPAPLGSTQVISLAAKQALYMGFSVEQANSGALLIKHELQLALDFDIRWAVPDINGKILRVDRGQVYRTAAMGSLW